MGLFNKFKKKNIHQENKIFETPEIISEVIQEQLLKVELNEQGIFINGNEIAFPIRLQELEKILGEPTRLYYERHDWRIIWDNHGIYTADNLDYISMLSFLIRPENRLEHSSERLFEGSILADGQPVENISEDTIKVNKYQINIIRDRSKQTNEIDWYILMRNLDYEEPADKDKYELSSTGNTIQFQDFNFKLLIIEELMYNQALLKPKFDVYEFVKLYRKREINIENEGDDPIPEVIKYFEMLEIDEELAKEVVELYQDGGNYIYSNIIPFWSGENGYFDIGSYADVKLFPNLKRMTVFKMDKKEVEILETKGIDVELL